MNDEERAADKSFFVKGEPVLSLNEKDRFLEGSVSSLYNGSHSTRMKVNIMCLENIELSKSASECFQITPSLSAHIHVSIHICQSCPFSLSLSNSTYCAVYEPYLLSTWLFFCLPALPLCLSTLPDLNMSVLLNKCPEVPYEVTLPGPVSSPSSLLEITWMALKLLLNKSSYKSTDCGSINSLNRAHTSKAARGFILIMRWRDALRISQLGLWFMPLNEVMP